MCKGLIYCQQTWGVIYFLINFVAVKWGRWFVSSTRQPFHSASQLLDVIYGEV